MVQLFCLQDVSMHTRRYCQTHTLTYRQRCRVISLADDYNNDDDVSYLLFSAARVFFFASI